MESIYTRNERLKEEILKPENCHCTYRVLTGLNTAIAKCNTSDKTRANITWFHTESKTRVVLTLPFGAHFTSTCSGDSGLEAIDTMILSLFVRMDAAWEGETS